jgi:hypothetical protein
MFNKMLAVSGCALLFALSLFSAAASASFPDVYSSNPNLDAINYVQQKGIVAGYADGYFEPDRPINRAEFVKIIIKTKFSDAVINACNKIVFRDLEAGAWYVPYICIAKQMEIVSGYSEGIFYPDNFINFAEAAKIIVRTLRSNELAAGKYPTGVWYEPYVRLLADAGAIPITITDLENSLTRGQMAELIYRLDAKITTKESLAYDEIGDRALIDSYYGKIYIKDYDEAYAMKINPEMSLDAFKQMYKDFPFVKIAMDKKVAAHTYDFYVMTGYPPNQKGKSELYHVNMEVVGGKLKTNSAVAANNISFEDAKFSAALSAKVVWVDGRMQVVTVKNGKEVLAKDFDAAELWPGSLRFSTSGNYLTFEVIGWEFGGVYVYDIVNNKVNEQVYQGTGMYGFADGEKYFYFCNPSGLYGGSLFVLNMPGFTMKRDFYKEGILINSCDGFDAKTNLIKYSLDYQPNIMSYSYDALTDKVIER